MSRGGACDEIQADDLNFARRMWFWQAKHPDDYVHAERSLGYSLFSFVLGIPLRLSFWLVVLGFLGEVLQRLPLGGVGEKVTRAIEGKLRTGAHA